MKTKNIVNKFQKCKFRKTDDYAVVEHIKSQCMRMRPKRNKANNKNKISKYKYTRQHLFIHTTHSKQPPEIYIELKCDVYAKKKIERK